MASSGEFPLTQRFKKKKNSQTPETAKSVPVRAARSQVLCLRFESEDYRCNDYPEEIFARLIRTARKA